MSGVALTRWVCLWVLTAACSGGPRFANPPEPGFEHWDTEEIDFSEGWSESFEEGDYPDALSTEQPIEAVLMPEQMYKGVIWNGTVGWGAVVSGRESEDLGICDDVGLFSYSGDMELLAFEHGGGGPLCVAAVTDHPGDHTDPSDDRRLLWESVLFRRGDDPGGCPDGSWLNEESQGGQATGEQRKIPVGIGSIKEEDAFYLYFGTDLLGVGEQSRGSYLLFLTGIIGSFSDAELGCDNWNDSEGSTLPCVSYSLAVASVPSQEACRNLYLALKEHKQL